MKGLPYMLDQEYFNDAFILHEESTCYMDLKQFFVGNKKKNLPMTRFALKTFLIR